MAGISQTINNFHTGISQQPDQKKLPGQVKDIVNGIPDVTEGLYKRPGSKRIGTVPLPNIQNNGSFFHYHRDETEGSYLGQVASDGGVRMWSCTDGDEKSIYYGGAPWQTLGEYDIGDVVSNGGNIYKCDTHGVSANSGSGPSGTGANITDGTTRWDYVEAVSTAITRIQSYLTPSSATATEDIQALTISDTTFLNNRTKKVTSTGTTQLGSHAHYAYIDLLRSENGRQYGLNIFSDSTTTNIEVN